MKIGLTLGKFAPLHKGHEYLINESYRILDGGRLYVVLYDDIYYRHIPLQQRADWIRNNPAFTGKDIQVIIGYNSPNDCGYSEDVIAIQNNYLLNTLGLKSFGITHMFSSEEYGTHVAKALNCEDVRIDMMRANVPISATEIRNNTYDNRKYISPHVYRDLIKTIVVLGGPGTGKTTLVEALAKEFKEPRCLEYGREYWEKYNVDRRLTPEQMEEICIGHLQREDEAIMEAREVCFIDTNPIVTYLFSMYYHGITTEKTKRLAEECISRYSKFVICDDGFEFNETEDRSGDVNRKLFQRMTIDYLDYKKIEYYITIGSVQERICDMTHFVDLLKYR
jgi:NadR type nicotinamide-nucleotide adenylyltransferase